MGAICRGCAKAISWIVAPSEHDRVFSEEVGRRQRNLMALPEEYEMMTFEQRDEEDRCRWRRAYLGI